jgi:hypothetical protein
MHNPLGTWEIWSHRIHRGWVIAIRQNICPIETVPELKILGTVGWAVRALDGTRVGDLYETRRKATIALLTDSRFNKKKLKLGKNGAIDKEVGICSKCGQAVSSTLSEIKEPKGDPACPVEIQK